MRKVWIIGLVAVTLVFAGMACSLLEREVPLEDTDIPLANNGERTGYGENGDEAGDADHGSIEVASIDLTRVWKPLGLTSYQSDFLMESKFDADSDAFDIILQSHYDVTLEPDAQHIISSHQNKLFPEPGSSLDSEIYIMDGVAYMKSNILSDEWSAFEGELADLMSDVLVNPQEYVFIPEKAERKDTPETINGISCWHYSYDETAFEDQSRFYRELNTELWIAVDGGYIVRSETEAYGGIERGDLSFSLPENAATQTTFNMTDINTDFTITLPPEAAQAEIIDLFGEFDSEWTREDVPFPEEAEIEYSFEDSISLQMPAWTVQQTKDFMLNQLPAYGWVFESDTLNSEDYYLGDFKKDNDLLTLWIEKDILEQDRTSIHIQINKIVPWSRPDVPLPQDALIEESFEGEVTLLTSLSLEDATDTMTTQLEANGWTPETGSPIADYQFIGTFIKDTETLSLIIFSNIDEQSRTRIWITIE